MTPAQHKSAAESLLTTAEAKPSTATNVDLLIAETHARLSKAAGTGTHYTTADTALANAEATGRAKPLDREVRLAYVHALLAD